MSFLIILFIEGIFKICGLTMNVVRVRVNAMETSTDFEGYQFYGGRSYIVCFFI